eukprot:1635973-Lingulodinium_polyedra.AAC.1
MKDVPKCRATAAEAAIFIGVLAGRVWGPAVFQRLEEDLLKRAEVVVARRDAKGCRGTDAVDARAVRAKCDERRAEGL